MTVHGTTLVNSSLTVDGTTLINPADTKLFNTSYGAPTLSTRSTGSKIVLYPAISSTNLDYSIGVETNDMFLLQNMVLVAINFMPE